MKWEVRDGKCKVEMGSEKWENFTMNRQEFYREEYRRLNPGWKDSQTIYHEILDIYTKEDTRILDVGCGHSDLLKQVHNKTLHTYGIDPDKKALGKNKFIKNKVVGSADNLPFQNNFFDLVISSWVLEHLENPGKVFQGIYRVLRPGGKVIFLTPNVWNYNVWFIMLIPNKLHNYFTRKLYGRQENDTYPVRYKINSVRKINKTLLPIGFKKIQLILNGDPSYISFNGLLFKLACLIERLFKTKLLSFAKVHIIGIYEKPT